MLCVSAYVLLCERIERDGWGVGRGEKREEERESVCVFRGCMRVQARAYTCRSGGGALCVCACIFTHIHSFICMHILSLTYSFARTVVLIECRRGGALMTLLLLHTHKHTHTHTHRRGACDRSTRDVA